MKYRVTGQHRETGARQVMEITAESRAAAERKATSAGMDVRHVEVMDPPVQNDPDPKPIGLGKWLILLLIILGAIGSTVYLYWNLFRNTMDR